MSVCVLQHLLKTTIEIPRDGTGRKPSMRRASHRVHFSTPVQNAIDDFSKLFAKFKVKNLEFPYIQSPGGVEKPAMPFGTLPESWYHRNPKTSKIIWHSKFPILREDDTFTDGQGLHATRKELNIPLHPGAMSLAGPFGAIHDWLHHHIPNLQLPVNLENMQPEERNALFTKIILEAHDGKKIRLSDILKPLTHTPNWKSFNPDDYTLLYEILRIPVKNMFIEGGIEFVITTPEGGQVSHIVPVRPGESWDQAANSFFFTYPQYDKIKTKLRLFDGEGNPIVLSPESSVYVGVKEAIEQKRRMRSTSVQEVQRFINELLRGADIVRPVRLRDLLSIVRKHIAQIRPDLIAQLNLPDPATSQREIAKLKAQIDVLKAKANKTAVDYDAIQGLRHQIKSILARENKWAVPSVLSFSHIRHKGAEKDFDVSLQSSEFRLADEFWKVYHHATRQSQNAAMLDFANVYNITFRVLGMEERVEEKKRTKQKIKAEKQAERHVRDVNVKVKLVFDVENDEAFSDSGIVISLPSDFATGLNIGGKRKVAQQLSKMYGIPKAYFTFDGYPRVVIDPAKSELPVLKVALQALCLRNDGKIGVRPAELAQVLIEKGGYGNKDYILLHAAAGEKLRVSVENARQIAPEKARMFMFAWKRKLSDITSAAEGKAKEKAKAAAGEVAEPAKWMEILGPWLSRMRGFGTLADTKIQLIVHNDKAATKSDRISKCRISTFEELLEYINDMQQLLKVCPGLLMAVTSGQPFSFDLGIRSPPPSGFRLWNRAHGDPGKNQRYLERLTVALSKVPSDSKIQWKFSKHGGGMTSDQIEKIKVLLQGNKPRDAALVREILAILGVPADDIERLTGRLNILITHEPTDQDKVLLLDIARADGPRIIRNISAHADPKTPLQIGLLDGDFSLSYSFYSPTKQISGQPCGIRSAQDFQNLTWETAVGWCNLTFDELKSHSPAFAWIEGVQMAMYPPSQPGIPVVSFQNDTPMAFTYRRPASPVSGIMPQDIYFNLVQQPGANAPGATFTQKIPEPSGGLGTDITYFGQNPQRWRARMDPGTVTMPRGTFGEFNIYPDPEQQEAGKAFVNPIIRTIEIPGFSHVPELKENLNIVFKPKTSVPMGGELVYIQAPASTGRYYFCPDLTIQQFMSLKSKEEVSRLCSNIPVELLEADFLVSTFAPLILVDRLNVPRYYTVAWDDDIDKFVEPLFQEGHPEDQVVFTFANANHCVATRPMLKGLKTWLELARFCSAIFGNNYPTQITGVIKVRILLPESLKTSFTKIHQGLSPESIFSYEPLALVIDNILAGQKAGITIEVTLEMNDGTKLKFNQIPEEWKNVTAPQIPGLVSIEIKDTNLGNLQDLLNQGNISPSMPFGQFVSKVTGDINSATGLAFPSANIRIGGPPSPGVPIPHYEFELVQPEAVGADGQTANFGVRIPLAHGSIPDAFPMGEVIKTLHNPQVTVITVMAGSNVPLTKHSQNLDMSFSDLIAWLKIHLGINDPAGIHVTVVVDGTPYRGTFTGEQLLGHSLGSLLGMIGAADLTDSHSLVFINFIVNGSIYDDKPGSPVDFAKLLQIRVPGKKQPPSDFEFTVAGPGGSSTQLVPADIMRLLQDVADMHGHPGMSLVLSFLNSLKQVSQVAPGQTIRIDTKKRRNSRSEEDCVWRWSITKNRLPLRNRNADAATESRLMILTRARFCVGLQHPEEAINSILSTPAGQLPRDSYLLVFTSEGPRGRRIMVPISPQDKKKTVAKLLQHLNIALQTILDLKIVSDVEDGALNVGVLDRTITIPIQTLSSTDRSTMDEFLSQMGQKLSSMLRSARLTYQHLVLHTILTKADGTKIFVDTPLGPPENAERMLSSLSLWSLLPDEARHEKIKHINMRIQAATTTSSRPATPTPPPQGGNLLPSEQTWGVIPGQPVNSIENFLIQLPSGERRPISEVGDQLVRAFFRSAVSRNRTWSRVFWGKQTAEGVCGPEMEFPYFMVMSTKIADLHAPQGHDCLALIKLNFEVGACKPVMLSVYFEVAYLYHEAPLQILTPKERKLYQAASMELEAVKRPLRELIARATGSNDVGNLMSCLITQPFVAYSCTQPLPVNADKETLEEIIARSRYVVLSMATAGSKTTGFLQKGSFLSRISRVHH
ncbi:uncharacterized protein LOC34623096 [Cyclospora cayetanensis]|uniref:Uncharacterized protein LOC34623096 n=1 Tax=Cyclospora cayetanensis TaxID=88456 RepID=A0A6P6RVS6_9EIME|nr:uncharacterized protein LOC34623096 [Cyclospora cayetanensis]